MGRRERVEIRLHHVVPEREDLGHLLPVRAVAFPLCRESASGADPGKWPDAPAIPLARAEQRATGPDADADADADSHAAPDSDRDADTDPDLIRRPRATRARPRLHLGPAPRRAVAV